MPITSQSCFSATPGMMAEQRLAAEFIERTLHGEQRVTRSRMPTKNAVMG